AEDGIRDYKVTGVQTCALPILIAAHRIERDPQPRLLRPRHPLHPTCSVSPREPSPRSTASPRNSRTSGRRGAAPCGRGTEGTPRSEERRVGKEGRSRWAP